MTNDLLAHLFMAYKAVSNCEFVTYIPKKEDEYEEGAEIKTNALMLLVDNKFKTFCQANTWNAPSLEEEKILALESQIQKLWKEKKKPKQQEGAKKGKDKDGTKKGKRKKKKDGPKWTWVPLADANKDKPKTIKGKQYYWCAHTKWAGHTTSACQGKGLRDLKPNQLETLPSPQTTPHLRLTRAMSALDSNSKWWFRPGSTLPPGPMATLDQLQKWGWLLFTTALLIPVLCTMHKPPTYIPKLQCSPFKRLMGQCGQVLKSWIKKASKDINSWRAT